MSEFKIPPISTLIGSNIFNFIRVIRNGSHIEPKYYFKVVLTALVILVSTPFHIWEYLYFKRSVKKYRWAKEPLFILGHWRSGTTFLHNMLCSDPEAAYLTTYHSVFPNTLASEFIFKNFMKMNMPEKRPSDNVKLGVDLPQEDEFALGNLTDKSFYHFFYFPNDYKELYRRATEEVNAGLYPEWDTVYKHLVTKALLHTGGKRIILKNPVNTARIKSILRIFPDAKFLFIYRNPITVFLSTRKFFYELFPTLWLHSADHSFIDEMIFKNFRTMMGDYERDKVLIPQRNRMEIRFEDFEADPLKHCKIIYYDLLNEDFSKKEGYFESFISRQKGYSKNNYGISGVLLNRIQSEWGEYMEMWGYNVPEGLTVE